MRAEYNSDMEEIDVYIEEHDMCKSCQKAYRCALIVSIKASFVYMASSKNFIEDCWDWQPYDDCDQELIGTKVI